MKRRGQGGMSTWAGRRRFKKARNAAAAAGRIFFQRARVEAQAPRPRTHAPVWVVGPCYGAPAAVFSQAEDWTGQEGVGTRGERRSARRERNSGKKNSTVHTRARPSSSLLLSAATPHPTRTHALLHTQDTRDNQNTPKGQKKNRAGNGGALPFPVLPSPLHPSPRPGRDRLGRLRLPHRLSEASKGDRPARVQQVATRVQGPAQQGRRRGWAGRGSRCPGERAGRQRRQRTGRPCGRPARGVAANSGGVAGHDRGGGSGRRAQVVQGGDDGGEGGGLGG